MSKAKLPEYDYDTIIIGGGPAGYTAGIYAARSGLKTLLMEGAATVSQITIADLIENYPGIPEGINGYDLMQIFKKQALNFGLEIITRDVSAIKKNENDPVIWNVTTEDKSFRTLSVIAATGAQWRKLVGPGEDEFAGRGVSYCATCDGFFFRGKNVVVVGGGDTALEEALYLARITRLVHLVHRRDALRGGRILQQRVMAEANIEILWNTIATEILANDQGVRGVTLQDKQTGVLRELPADGVFIFIGFLPNNQLVPEGIRMDHDGYVMTNEKCETNLAGIFVIGDLRQKYARQIVTAAAEGCTAALAAALCVEMKKSG